MTHHAPSHEVTGHAFIQGVHGIRYQVKDVARSVAFYTQRLGFELDHEFLDSITTSTVDLLP